MKNRKIPFSVSSLFKTFVVMPFLFFLLIGFTRVSFAEPVKGLYAVQAAVASETEKDRATAFGQALLQVVTKVSGKTKPETIKPILAATKKASDYVRGFSYSNSSTNDRNSLILNMNFNASAVNNLIKEAGLSVLSNNRPTTLLWIVVKDEKGQRTFVKASAPAAVLVTQEMQARGLPFSFPTLDQDDLAKARASDVEALLPDSILKASARYSPEAVLMVAIMMQPDGSVKARWLLNLQTQQPTWETTGALPAAIAKGVDHVTDTLMQSFSGASNALAASHVVIKVIGLNDVADYGAVLHFLKHTAGIVNVDVKDVSAQEALFDVTLTEDVDSLKRELGLGHTLQLVPSGDLGADASALTYQFRKT
jgi:hypothetical protein